MEKESRLDGHSPAPVDRDRNRTAEAASLVLLAASLGCLASCSSTPTLSIEHAQNTGTVGLDLDAGPSVTLHVVEYAIVGPDFKKQGSIDVSASASFSAILSGIPSGGLYTITLSALATDGLTQCGGSGVFSVGPNVTTRVAVHLNCHKPPRTGSIGLNGIINVCPTLNSLEARPSETVVGHSIALSASANDEDGRPEPLAYHWSASAGTLNDAAAQAPTFTCTSVGRATIGVAVSDGDGQPGCAATASVVVSCMAEGADAGVTGGEGGPAEPGGSCLFNSDHVVFNTDARGTTSQVMGPLRMRWSQSDNRVTEFAWDSYQLVTINPYFNQIGPTDTRQVFWDYALTVGPTPVNDGLARQIRGYVSNQFGAGSGLGSFSGLFEGASAQFWMGAQGSLDCDFGLSSGVHITNWSPTDGARIDVGDGTCRDSTTHLTVASRDGRSDVDASYEWTATFYGPDGVTPERSDVPIGTGADVAWVPALGGEPATNLDSVACGSGSPGSPTAGQKIKITVTASDTSGSHRSHSVFVYALCTPC
jgi:hypothetical protein